MPLGVDAILRGWDKTIRTEAHDWGARIVLGERAIMHVEPAHHWSARGVFDRRRTLWASFAFETPAGVYYHVGDTGFFGGRNYRAAREKHGPAKLAFLPIGAYDPRFVMAPQHQDPDEAVRGARFLEAEMAIGSHWGYWQLTDEAVDDPSRKLAAALARWDHPPARFRAGRPGEVTELPIAIDAPKTKPLPALGAAVEPTPDRLDDPSATEGFRST